MKRFNFFYLSFFELFSLVIVVASIVAFYTAGSFNFHILNRIAPIFYILLSIVLLSISIFKFKFNNILFVIVLVLFSFYYTSLRYNQNDKLSQNYSNFTACIASDIEYKNGHSNFEGILLEKSRNNMKQYVFGPKVMVYTDSIYSGLLRGRIIRGKGDITFIDRKKSVYNLYLFSKNIDYTIDRAHIENIGFLRPKNFYIMVFKLKRYIEKVCNRILPYPHSTFAGALLTGNRNQIPYYLSDIFKKVGTLHILAISGLHVGFIAGIFIIILMLIGFRHIHLYLMASISIILYALFIGGSPSVKRASMMFVFGVLLYIFDRDRDYVNLLAVIFTILMLYNPRSILNPGFLLSFFATFGIIYLSSEIKRSLYKYIHKVLSDLISMSIAASIYTFPILVSYFGSFPYISVIANIAVIPLTALILVLSIFMIVTYPIFMPLSILIAYLNSFFISLLFSINVAFSYVPSISFNFKAIDNMGVFIYYGIITFLVYYFVKRRENLEKFKDFA